MKKIFSVLSLLATCYLLLTPCRAAELFDPKDPIQDGLDVFRVSDTFADIYQQLDSVKWAGKSINVAIESLEKLDKNAHIAATDDRVVLVWRDSIVGNWPRPDAGNWRDFGQVTTALVLKLRSYSPALRALSESGVYEAAVGSLMQGIDENGKYVYSKHEEVTSDGRLLTSAGLEGAQDGRGNFRVTGIYRGGLADAQGIREGDLITDINGQSTTAMTPADISAAMTGFNSGTLKLTVLNQSGSRPVILRRATVIIADADVIFKNIEGSEQSMAGKGILEIVVTKVSNNSAAIINEALMKYADQTAGIVLDLRAAVGDDEKAAAKLAGLFMGRMPVLRSVETASAETEITPGGDAVIPKEIPVVVLVSGGTSGTAEALAAAFYENSRGLLVGTPTSGTARLATRLDLKNGGQLMVMNRMVKTGAGRVIDGRGVFPIVCLSNIRNDDQRDAFFVNVMNDDFGARDFNKETDIDPRSIRKGCPAIKSGADEDSVASAVDTKILTDKKIYDALMDY